LECDTFRFSQNVTRVTSAFGCTVIVNLKMHFQHKADAGLTNYCSSSRAFT